MSLLPAPSEWSPLEEQFHTWDIVLLNPPPLGGSTQPQTKVLSLWSGISITETHEGIRTQVDINAEEPAVPFIRELITDFLFFRDGELRYRLRVVDSEDILTRDAATVRFDCVSYDKLLERRILHEDWLLDDGDINAAWRLIDYTQRKQSFGITRGTTNPGIRRQRALDAGDDILTAVNDFAQAKGGFDWWIDANLKFWAVKPRRGKRHNLQWQLGGEVAEMTRMNPIEDYSSLIMATGANSEVRIPRDDGEEDVYPPPDPQIVQLPNKPLGLWELTTSDTDVITTASLLEKAQWHLGDKGNIRPSYKLMLEPGVWQPIVAVGDILTLRIDTVRANVKVPIRIEELSINCTSDGAETVSMSVRAEEPETPISAEGGQELVPVPQLLAPNAPPPDGRTVQHHRLDAADDLGALLRSMRKRLDRAERSRGMGGGSGSGILDGEGPPTCLTGSPGNYYVDRLDWRLYGPKYDGGTMLAPGETWDFREVVSTPNDRVLDSEVGYVGYVFEDVDIIGFKFDGLTCGATDSFDRANGPLGDNWLSTPNIPAWHDQNYDLTIVDKNAVGSTADPSSSAPWIGNTMRWATPQPVGDTQAIEISANFGQQGGYFYLFTNANGANGACQFVECSWLPANFGVEGNLFVQFTTFRPDGTSEDYESEYLTAYFQSGGRFRLESDPSGEQRLYWDNGQWREDGQYALLKTWTASAPVAGPYCGFGTAFGGVNGLPTPTFYAVTVGCIGAGISGAKRSVTPHGVTGNLTVSIWDWDRGELLYRTTAPAAGTDWVETPPIRFSVRSTVHEAATGASSRWAVSIGGAAVPVHFPGHQFTYDHWPSSVGAYGAYTGPVGSSPTKMSGYFGPMPLLYIKFQSQKCYAATPEDVDTLSEGARAVEPDALVSGEVGKVVSVYNRGWLLGWRYKRLATSSSPVTFTVWKWTYRYYSPVYANIRLFPDSILAQVTVDHTGEGEFEVRLPTPLLMDFFGRQGPQAVMISVGGAAIGIDTSTTGVESGQFSAAGWYNYHFGESYLNPVIGQFPNDGLGSYPNYHVWPMYPIMQRGDLTAWPTTDLARSGSTSEVEGERAELHRNLDYPTSGNDYNGLRFYESGPSHDATRWAKGEGVPAFSASLIYDGYSGVALLPDDWYDEYGHTVYPEPLQFTNKYAWYYWAYDYAWTEQDADLDPNHPTTPDSYYMTFTEQSCWDYYAYGDFNAYGPRYGAGIDSPDYVGVSDGGAGLSYEVCELPDDTTTAIARMWVLGDDGLSGTSLNVTPWVIQACFPPEGQGDTWYNGRYSEGSMTPKGCVSPLVTAAHTTATAADEPWQKQFFRQIGSTLVNFTGGIGTIGVPTGMALPAVVNAQVEGIAVGGTRVAQAARTGNYTITVALDTAHTGDLLIGWIVEHAVLTFGTPPPSIDVVRNPGSQYQYGNIVDYDEAGGMWPFEIASSGHTFQNGCVLYDFTGAQVGGPFNPVDEGYYQTIQWSAGRNWYLPGQEQLYRMQNPDEQFSNWSVIRWVEQDVFVMQAVREGTRKHELVAEGDAGVESRAGTGIGSVDTPGSTPGVIYANDPKIAPAPSPLARGAKPRGEKGKRRGGKELRQARQERQRQERQARFGQPTEEPPAETTPE
jgi:hypothetical protein